MRTAKNGLRHLVATFVVALPTSVVAAEVRIIANPSIKADAVSSSELKAIFLQEHNSLRDGAHVEPVLERKGPTHEAFLKEYLRQSDDSLQDYYRSLVFTGKAAMPKILASDEEVVAYVAKTRGAIGYVGANASVDGVKVLEVSFGEVSSRKLLNRIEPSYPDLLKIKRIGGTVRLKVTVAANGNVEDTLLLGGNPILGDAAIAAVKHWTYSPSRSRTITEVSLSFDPNR